MADTSGDSPYDFADEPAPKPKPPAKPAKPPATSRNIDPALRKPRTSTDNPPKPDARPPIPDYAATPDAATERTCPHCGFVYFGKPRARCPECAAPQDASSASMLQFADARWVRSVATGCLILIAAIAIHMLGSILKWTHSSQPTFKGWAHAIGAVLLVAGTFLATRKDPASPASPAAIIARILAGIALVGWLYFLSLAFKVAAHQEGLPDNTVAFKGLLGLVLLSQAALAVVLGFHLRSLAGRIPDDSLASHAFHAGWIVAIVCSAMAVIYACEMQKGYFPMFFMCSFPLIAGFVAIFVWAMVTLLRLNFNLRAAAVAGETITLRKSERAAARNKKPDPFKG
ncbi:MAG TPA: hypothetical protein VHM90_06585 [Phycisphaerae bacterium]|nr:hypothetical protein [Phycisphaerae bacterium]